MSIQQADQTEEALRMFLFSLLTVVGILPAISGKSLFYNLLYNLFYILLYNFYFSVAEFSMRHRNSFMKHKICTDKYKSVRLKLNRIISGAQKEQTLELLEKM